MKKLQLSVVWKLGITLAVVLGMLAPGIIAAQPIPIQAAVVGDNGLPVPLPTSLPPLPQITTGLPALPRILSSPLIHVLIPSREGVIHLNNLPASVRAGSGRGEKSGAPIARPQPAQVCSQTSIDLKVLIITADPTDTQTALPAIEQALDYQGTPYTVFTASPRPSDATTDRLSSLLSSGCQANFEGVILGNGEVAYSDPTAGWESALTNPEWQSLWSYEQTFAIRQVTWYTYPTSEYGFNPPSSGQDTTTNPISATYMSAAQPVFSSYANTANPLTIQNVWAYKATPLDSTTSPLLQDSSGDALVAVKTYSNGTQNLAMTFDSNANVTHTQVLAYGVINWVTNGLFLGERHIFMVPQEDDLFIDDHIWTEGTACGSNPELTPNTYRITGDDFQAFINWQTAVQSQASTRSFRLAHAFVGEGTNGEYSPDTLTPKAQAVEGDFNWINHTYNHDNLNNTTYDQTSSQITQNITVAENMGFTNFSTLSLVTPDISGLSNPDAMQAMYDNGIRYVVSDTSQPGQNNPSPNIGINNQYQPAILEIPRRPNNLYYNVTNPEQWTEEYNCTYSSYWGRNLTYSEILSNESGVLLHYLLNGEMDPWMFHQPNLRAYDGTHSLLGDLMDNILTQYNNLYVLPVVTPTMDDLGARMARRMAYSSAGVNASVMPGQSITITSQGQAVVPVTGLQTSGAESYGGQSISHVALNAGQTVTISLGGSSPTSTPVPSSTPTSPPTATNTPTSIPSATNTPRPTSTPTSVPSATSTSQPTNTPTSVPSATNTPTNIPTATATLLPTNTPTSIPTPTATQAPTNTPTLAPTPTSTPITNHAPVANADSYSMHLLNVVLSVSAPGVLGNDTDADGNTLTAVVVTSTSNGVLIFNSNGSFTYTPLTSLLTFNDSFTYKAFDGTEYSNVATVSIRVNVP